MLCTPSGRFMQNGMKKETKEVECPVVKECQQDC